MTDLLCLCKDVLLSGDTQGRGHPGSVQNVILGLETQFNGECKWC